jgi:hypothetical protein
MCEALRNPIMTDTLRALLRGVLCFEDKAICLLEERLKTAAPLLTRGRFCSGGWFK